MPMITLGQTTIAYTVEIRPRRHYPAIEMDAHKAVTVLVPPDWPPEQIEPLLHRKARWLLHHFETTQPVPVHPPKDFVSGAGFLLRGSSGSKSTHGPRASLVWCWTDDEVVPRFVEFR
ncbi:YgjP-like metallopeptidase domain-containing protein [Sulfobacillus thermosulfidooxidans]|uniref:YgjP-like metallopeptidase domain-containing protein n=1 Tax=Sulfobacillus thermosulfidooxidans TaxID=28034 RepID=UPI0006B5ACDE|nr:YgjP-like metallopeptidase domain-containing protein [Sulfobacillus thermosulfidooxidans]